MNRKKENKVRKLRQSIEQYKETNPKMYERGLNKLKVLESSKK